MTSRIARALWPTAARRPAARVPAWVVPALVAPLMVMPAAVWASTLEECLAHRRHGRAAAATQCFEELSLSRDPYLRAEGLWGLGQHSEANNQFRAAVKLKPKEARYRVRWGRLFLERYVPGEAATLFQEVLREDEKNASALLGLALVAADGFDSKAAEFAAKALEVDPKLVEARELLAALALEDADPAKAIEHAGMALALSPEALDALAVRAAVEEMADRSPREWMDRIHKVNPRYGRAHEIIGRLMVLNRRYEEGIAHYAKAVEMEPGNDAARSELGINLMRLGREKQAREHLEQAYANGWKNSPTVNTLRLMDSYKNFVTVDTTRASVRLHKKEADLLKLYVPAETDRAIEAFEKKYKLKLPERVRLEVYPDHEDFAVRTMGMPGLGALGVTFGTVVAMDSPSGRKPGNFHWASTLWHELSHVFVLTATNHRVPRWFTEGLAVHEETAASPDWGDRMTPDIVGAIKDKRLLAVRELDRGFIRPTYPTQVVVSYFQAGRICDFINEKWGYSRLLEMMHDFGARKTTAEVIEGRLGMKPEAFDQAFLEWLDHSVGARVRAFDEWRKRMKELAVKTKTAPPDDVVKEATALSHLFPEYIEHGSAYEIAADAWQRKGDKGRERAALDEYARVGGRDPKLLKRLAALQREAGRGKEAAATLEKLNYIYPVKDEELHRQLGEIYLEQGNVRLAIREFQAVVAEAPLDKAAAHFQLARAYMAARQAADAQIHVLEALEAAPGFRPAQKLLLEIHEGRKEKP